MPLAVAPPRKSRFGGPLSLSKVHWVQPRLVAEVTYLTWTKDGLLRHTVFVGLREQARERRAPRVAESLGIGREKAIAPLGHINTMEIVKVERQLPSAGNKWLISDQSRKHIETRVEALISPDVQEALGDETEGYFQGDWSAEGWKIGDGVVPPKGW